MADSLILLVNDIPDHARAYEYALLRSGYRVQLVHTAAAALQAARAEQPSCTVIDVRLPDVTGWTLCRAMKDEHSLAPTPIVMLTDNVSESCARDAAESGCSAWLAHPANAHDVVRTVDHVLAQERSSPAAGEAVVGIRACQACGSERIRATLRLDTIQYYACRACGFSWRMDIARVA
jgi:CheY-like chemotaxis protein